MKLKFKKLLVNACIPKYAKEGDAGFDFTATSKHYDEETGVLTYGTGLSCEIEPGHEMEIRPRSSIYKLGLSLCNSCATIDSGYRGEILLKFYHRNKTTCYNIGDRIGQGIIHSLPIVEISEVEELSSSDRGEGGFGSTGLNNNCNAV